MGTPDGVEADGKSDVIRNQQKLNHAAVIEKIGRIAHGEGVGIPKCREILLHVLLLGSGEIRDGAAARIGFVEIRFLKPNDADGAAVDFFAGCDVVERASEWVLAEDADIEIGGGLGSRRNTHELAEVEQVGGFHGVFRQAGLSQKRSAGHEERPEQRERRAADRKARGALDGPTCCARRLGFNLSQRLGTSTAKW